MKNLPQCLDKIPVITGQNSGFYGQAYYCLLFWCYQPYTRQRKPMSKDNLVVKSNRLVEASYRLDLIEQRIILAAIATARETQKGLGEDYISLGVGRFVSLFGMEEGSVYGQTKQAMDTLFHRYVVVWDTDPETGLPRQSKIRWISSASYVDGAGTVQLRFTPEMVPYISQLERKFTAYRLEKIGRLTSVYAVRLYELLVQYLNIGRREFKLSNLREILGLEQEYKSINDFKKRIIDVAVAQINEFTDLTVSYEQRKTGRTVTHFIFTFALKAPAETVQPPTENIAADVRESPLFQRLRNLGIGPKLAGQWLHQDGGRVAAALDYVEGKIEKGEVQGKAAGYFRRVFESGSEFGESAFAADVKAKTKAEAEAKKRAEAEQRAKEKAEREATEQAKAVIRTLPALERLMLAEEYRKGPGADYSNSWDPVKGDFRQAIERIQFNVWLINRFKSEQ
jgi:hypothetical protein